MRMAYSSKTGYILLIYGSQEYTFRCVPHFQARSGCAIGQDEQILENVMHLHTSFAYTEFNKAAATNRFPE